jgi:hypothetical protein
MSLDHPNLHRLCHRLQSTPLNPLSLLQMIIGSLMDHTIARDSLKDIVGIVEIKS